MSLWRQMGLMFARLVALAVTLLGGWLFIINLIELNYEGWVLAWILVSGLIGAIGGPLFLLSIDGPRRFRVRSWRMSGWLLMLGSVLLPTSFQLYALPLVLLLAPTTLLSPGPHVDTSESPTSA
jgi:hypothetical protein